MVRSKQEMYTRTTCGLLVFLKQVPWVQFQVDKLLRDHNSHGLQEVLLCRSGAWFSQLDGPTDWRSASLRLGTHVPNASTYMGLRVDGTRALGVESVGCPCLSAQ